MGRGLDALVKAPGPIDTIRFSRMFDEGGITRKIGRHGSGWYTRYPARSKK
jgi:hypothetical protein